MGSTQREIMTKLNELGHEGWELSLIREYKIPITGGGEASRSLMILKRPCGQIEQKDLPY